MKYLVSIMTTAIITISLSAQETAPPPPSSLKPPPPSSLNKTTTPANRFDTLQPDNKTWLNEAQASDSLKRNFDDKYGSDSANDWKRRINQQDTSLLRNEQQWKQKAEADRRKNALDSSLGATTQRRPQLDIAKDSALTADKDRSRQPADSTKKLGDRIAMTTDGLTLYKGGNTTLIKSETKLDDGTVAMADGSLKLRSGKIIMLKNGQYINIKPVTKTSAKPVARTKKKNVER